MITIQKLSKRFGKLEVLRQLDLEIRPGRVTAIVGPNAAGKTTLIKILLGLTRCDEGVLRLDGEPIGEEPSYRARIGYMPQIARFPDNLCAAELVRMLSDLRGGAARIDDDLIGSLRLDEEMEKPLRTLSGGTRQKVNAVIAFLFDPAVLILDEPTAGLDPVSSGILKDKVRRERDAGKTVILTSHIMSEVEELADDVIFLLDGRVRFSGAVHDLKMRTRQLTLERAVAQLMLQMAAA